RFDALTLKEVIAIDPATSPTILVLLKDTKINELGTKINELYLGSIMGYTLHTDGEWYLTGHVGESESKATNMVKLLSGYRVGDINSSFASNLLTKFKEDLTVTDVFGTIESTSPLSLIQDEKIGDIQTELPEKIKTAQVQTLIATGILPLTAAQQATLTSKFGESWKSMNITQFFDMLISAISYMPDIP
ncbi:MAG: hypothetical protein SOT34_07015, partial [Candidatus Borkfalkiaceae bacterium]|nr:hypothetical protein [Christensenellaceae bacterium]